MIHRRGFLTGLFSTLAAPAIVRVENIMPVRAALTQPSFEEMADLLRRRMNEAYAVMRQNMCQSLYGDA